MTKEEFLAMLDDQEVISKIARIIAYDPAIQAAMMNVANQEALRIKALLEQRSEV